jgi:signal transduction histidine kinase
MRHAHASAATVNVRYRPDAVVLEVQDDGSGNANGLAAAQHDGHGLIGMRERAVALGGTLKAEAVPGGGFRVRATLPTARPH